MLENATLSIKATRRIFKYAEGTSPETHEPESVEEKEIMLYGKEAEQLLEDMGVDGKKAIQELKEKKLKEEKDNGVN